MCNKYEILYSKNDKCLKSKIYITKLIINNNLTIIYNNNNLTIIIIIIGNNR